MSMKQEVLATVLGTVLLGGGTMVLNAHRENSVQDKEIEQLKEDNTHLGDAVGKLNETVQALDKNVAVLNDRMDRK
jgi:hypothetical protein